MIKYYELESYGSSVIVDVLSRSEEADETKSQFPISGLYNQVRSGSGLFGGISETDVALTKNAFITYLSRNDVEYNPSKTGSPILSNEGDWTLVNPKDILNYASMIFYKYSKYNKDSSMTVFKLQQKSPYYNSMRSTGDGPDNEVMTLDNADIEMLKTYSLEDDYNTLLNLFKFGRNVSYALDYKILERILYENNLLDQNSMMAEKKSLSDQWIKIKNPKRDTLKMILKVHMTNSIVYKTIESKLNQLVGIMKYYNLYVHPRFILHGELPDLPYISDIEEDEEFIIPDSLIENELDGFFDLYKIQPDVNEVLDKYFEMISSLGDSILFKYESSSPDKLKFDGYKKFLTDVNTPGLDISYEAELLQGLVNDGPLSEDGLLLDKEGRVCMVNIDLYCDCGSIDEDDIHVVFSRDAGPVVIGLKSHFDPIAYINF